MAEGLINRVKRLVSGSVNTLVDAVENSAPETVMKEAIREIDNAIDEVRDQLGLSIANKHHANKRLMEASAKHEDLTEKLRLAVSSNRDDLAEAAISRQLDLEAQIPILEDALKDNSSEEAELESYIAALAGRRREMEEDLQTYLASRAQLNEAESSSVAATAGGRPDRKIENAETAFNRVLRGATGIPGTAKSDRDTSVKLAELEKVSRENRVKERLAAIKAIKSAD